MPVVAEGPRTGPAPSVPTASGARPAATAAVAPPELAPGVGTTVPGGAPFREAHLIMEMLCDSGLVSSLDLVELNPFLDDRGKGARILVELTASLFGRRILDRPTRSA